VDLIATFSDHSVARSQWHSSFPNPLHLEIGEEVAHTPPNQTIMWKILEWTVPSSWDTLAFDIFPIRRLMCIVLVSSLRFLGHLG
jgi:hypothetical protein